MGLLLYKSNEMFSSTELIRKSKKIFNKIIDEEIDKAIIMRDGKPGFLLMDFAKYEEIMAEFEMLKAQSLSKPIENKRKKKVIIENNPVKELKKEEEPSELREEPKVNAVKLQPSQVIPPRPIKEEIIVEKDDKAIIDENKKSIDQEENILGTEVTEEEEIKKALESIKSMNFDDNMKAHAEKKIKERILEARRNREKLKIKEEIENKVDLKEELKIQVHIKEENKIKERELKEFWD
jgi:hypothetical protein